jgi:hypothetical protein
VEPTQVAEVIQKYGRLVVGEGGELMVEFTEEKAAEELSAALIEHFSDQVLIGP